MIKLRVKPMSVNKAWKGRQRKSYYYLNYEKEIFSALRGIKKNNAEKEFCIHYIFYLKKISYSRSDVGNFEKPITDILVKAGVINDDRYIKKITLEKKLSDTYSIEIFIN